MWLLTRPASTYRYFLPGDAYLHEWHVFVDLFFVFDSLFKRHVSPRPFFSCGCPRCPTLHSICMALPFEFLGSVGTGRELKIWLNVLNFYRISRLFGRRSFHNPFFGSNHSFGKENRPAILLPFFIPLFIVNWMSFRHLGVAFSSDCSWFQRGQLEHEAFGTQ